MKRIMQPLFIQGLSATWLKGLLVKGVISLLYTIFNTVCADHMYILLNKTISQQANRLQPGLSKT